MEVEAYIADQYALFPEICLITVCHDQCSSFSHVVTGIHTEGNHWCKPHAIQLLSLLFLLLCGSKSCYAAACSLQSCCCILRQLQRAETCSGLKKNSVGKTEQAVQQISCTKVCASHHTCAEQQMQFIPKQQYCTSFSSRLAQCY